MLISSIHKHNFPHPSHIQNKFLNMTTTRTFTINTICRHGNTTTSTMYRHPIRHNPNKTYLFYLFPQDILTEIDFLASGLEHCDKLKAVITKINPFFKPILFVIPQELWAPYHNFSVYGSFYNYFFTHGHIGAFLLTRACNTKTYPQVIIWLLKR